MKGVIYMVDLYSTGCPRCRILERKLDEKGVQYQKHTDVDEMLKLGLTAAPALLVDGEMKEFSEAVRWINEQGA